MSLKHLEEFSNKIEEKRIKPVYQILNPESIYDPKKKRQRTEANLCDYREFINNRKNTVKESKKLDEDCGCGGSSSHNDYVPNKSIYSQDPNLGKLAKLVDGRSGIIDDAIRNSTGEVIGYVMNNEKGTFRVFKEKIADLSESGAMASLDTVSGMGNVSAPTATSTGSGDQFPSLNVGTGAAKRNKKKKSEDTEKKSTGSVMGWKDFRKEMLKSQSAGK